MKTMKEIRQMTGMTQAAFSEAYNIPLRTLQSWESGERTPAEYTLDMINRLAQIETTPVYAWYLVAMEYGGDGIMIRLDGIRDEIEAQKHIRDYWERMVASDQAKYTGDRGTYFGGLYQIVWDDLDEEWICEGDPVAEILIK